MNTLSYDNVKVYNGTMEEAELYILNEIMQAHPFKLSIHTSKYLEEAQVIRDHDHLYISQELHAQLEATFTFSTK